MELRMPQCKQDAVALGMQTTHKGRTRADTHPQTHPHTHTPTHPHTHTHTHTHGCTQTATYRHKPNGKQRKLTAAVGTAGPARFSVASPTSSPSRLRLLVAAASTEAAPAALAGVAAPADSVGSDGNPASAMMCTGLRAGVVCGLCVCGSRMWIVCLVCVASLCQERHRFSIYLCEII